MALVACWVMATACVFSDGKQTGLVFALFLILGPGWPSQSSLRAAPPARDDHRRSPRGARSPRPFRHSHCCNPPRAVACPTARTSAAACGVRRTDANPPLHTLATTSTHIARSHLANSFTTIASTAAASVAGAAAYKLGPVPAPHWKAARPARLSKNCTSPGSRARRHSRLGRRTGGKQRWHGRHATLGGARRRASHLVRVRPGADVPGAHCGVDSSHGASAQPPCRCGQRRQRRRLRPRCRGSVRLQCPSPSPAPSAATAAAVPPPAPPWALPAAAAVAASRSPTPRRRTAPGDAFRHGGRGIAGAVVKAPTADADVSALSFSPTSGIGSRWWPRRWL